MLRERTDAEFMTDENEPSEREERLASIKEELLHISKDISTHQSDINSLEDEIGILKDAIGLQEVKYEELMLEAQDLE